MPSSFCIMSGGLRSLYSDVKQDSWLLQTLKQKVTKYCEPKTDEFLFDLI